MHIITDSDVKRSLAWLQHNSNVYSTELVEHWKSTAAARFEVLSNSEGKLQEYLQKYPILSDPTHGYSLIEIDFELIYNTAVNDLYLKWNEVFEQLTLATSTKKKSATITDYESILTDEDVNPR